MRDLAMRGLATPMPAMKPHSACREATPRFHPLYLDCAVAGGEAEREDLNGAAGEYST